MTIYSEDFISPYIAVKVPIKTIRGSKVGTYDSNCRPDTAKASVIVSEDGSFSINVMENIMPPTISDTKASADRYLLARNVDKIFGCSLMVSN
jgi:hypothetical protein